MDVAFWQKSRRAQAFVVAPKAFGVIAAAGVIDPGL